MVNRVDGDRLKIFCQFLLRKFLPFDLENCCTHQQTSTATSNSENEILEIKEYYQLRMCDHISNTDIESIFSSCLIVIDVTCSFQSEAGAGVEWQ